MDFLKTFSEAKEDAIAETLVKSKVNLSILISNKIFTNK